jgi:CBS domain-containing protein
MSLKIGEIMIKDVVKIDGDVTAKEVAVILNERAIGCVIVVQNENPIGIITDRDMLRRVLLESRDPKTTKAFQIMTAPLFFGNPHMSIQEAVQLMSERKIRKLPIIDDEGRLVGMITLTDLARSVAYLEHIFSKDVNNAKQ